MEAVRASYFAPANKIARRFVAARLNAVALTEYPGPIPPDLVAAYGCQEAAIALWPDEIAGWKIGRIPPEHEQRLGAQRLAGPIFRREVRRSVPGLPVEYGVFEGGFAAVEAEFVFEIRQDAPAGKTSWSLSDASAIAGRMFVGIETAGSPLSTINTLGPTVTVSDFGNNAGLILGPEVPDWRERAPAELTCETFIYGKSVGAGSAANVLGGPLESLRFVAELCAMRGRPLKAGMLITTGAATGIHEVTRGQMARVEFNGIGGIQCVATARTAEKN
jgi:2-keto-4-pentenoate hydratase